MRIHACPVHVDWCICVVCWCLLMFVAFVTSATQSRCSLTVHSLHRLHLQNSAVMRLTEASAKSTHSAKHSWIGRSIRRLRSGCVFLLMFLSSSFHLKILKAVLSTFLTIRMVFFLPFSSLLQVDTEILILIYHRVWWLMFCFIIALAFFAVLRDEPCLKKCEYVELPLQPNLLQRSSNLVAQEYFFLKSPPRCRLIPEFGPYHALKTLVFRTQPLPFLSGFGQMMFHQAWS